VPAAHEQVGGWREWCRSWAPAAVWGSWHALGLWLAAELPAGVLLLLLLLLPSAAPCCAALHPPTEEGPAAAFPLPLPPHHPALHPLLPHHTSPSHTFTPHHHPANVQIEEILVPDMRKQKYPCLELATVALALDKYREAPGGAAAARKPGAAQPPSKKFVDALAKQLRGQLVIGASGARALEDV
jgi:hypothetical protein